MSAGETMYTHLNMFEPFGHAHDGSLLLANYRNDLYAKVLVQILLSVRVGKGCQGFIFRISMAAGSKLHALLQAPWPCVCLRVLDIGWSLLRDLGRGHDMVKLPGSAKAKTAVTPMKSGQLVGHVTLLKPIVIRCGLQY